MYYVYHFSTYSSIYKATQFYIQSTCASLELDKVHNLLY